MKVGDAVIIKEDPHGFAADGTVGHVETVSRLSHGGVELWDIRYPSRSDGTVVRPLTMRCLTLATPEALNARADALEAEAVKLREMARTL